MMGCRESKHMIKSKACVNDVLKEKVRLAQQEIGEISFKREEEIKVYEQAMMFEIKEEEWKKEKKRLREQFKRLKKKLEDKDEEILMLLGEKATSITTGGSNHQKVVLRRRRQEDKFLMEYMKEQELHREEAVEKWKQLYLTIKMELDDLIQRTYRGGRISWRVEDEMMEEIHREMKAKEETIQVLKTRLAALEEEGSKRETKFDILREAESANTELRRKVYPHRQALKLEYVEQAEGEFRACAAQKNNNSGPVTCTCIRQKDSIDNVSVHSKVEAVI